MDGYIEVLVSSRMLFINNGHFNIDLQLLCDSLCITAIYKCQKIKKGGRKTLHTLSHLKEALNQKEQALVQYVRYMREAQDSQNNDMAALFADLAKAEEKHISVIRDQVANLSGSIDLLNTYQDDNQYNAQHIEETIN
jgi:hypothetical protein